MIHYHSDLPTKATGVLEQFSTSQAGIDVFSDQIIQAVHDGELNPIELRVRIAAMEKILERIKKETLGNQITAAEKYPEKRFDYAGATVQLGEFGTKYDYTVCNDESWNNLDKIEKSIKQQKSDREKFLKSLQRPTTIVDDDGVVQTINPPLKSSVTGLSVLIR
jgi:hypothetical protein